MVAIAFFRTTSVPAHFDFLQDVLSGLNVRPYNYLADDVQVELDPHFDDSCDMIIVPFVVTVYNDGLDYDDDGNAYFDDYPADLPASFHRTRKGAETEAAWLQHNGVEQWRIRIEEDFAAQKWELQYHPMRD